MDKKSYLRQVPRIDLDETLFPPEKAAPQPEYTRDRLWTHSMKHYLVGCLQMNSERHFSLINYEGCKWHFCAACSLQRFITFCFDDKISFYSTLPPLLPDDDEEEFR